MAKAQTKIAKLNARGPPTVAAFVEGLDGLGYSRWDHVQYEDDGYGGFMPEVFNEDTGWDPRQSISLRSAHKVAMGYVKVHRAIGTEFRDIDDWMVGPARFVLSPDALKDSEEEKAELLKAREELTACVEDPSRDKFGKIKVYTLIPRSLGTYVNALLHGFNMANPFLRFYVNNEYQVPQ